MTLKEECRTVMKRADICSAIITNFLGSKSGKTKSLNQLPSFETFYKIYRVCGENKKLFEYYEIVSKGNKIKEF